MTSSADGASGGAAFTAVYPADVLGAKGMVAVQVGATRVLLVDVKGEVRAYDNRCPHQAWPLERGDLDEGELTCANHKYEFDVATGRGVNPTDCALVS